MREYQIKDEKGESLTFQDYDIVNKRIKESFPGSLIQSEEDGNSRMDEHDFGNGNNTYLFYLENKSIALTNKKNKKTIESKTKLKLEEI